MTHKLWYYLAVCSVVWQQCMRMCSWISHVGKVHATCGDCSTHKEPAGSTAHFTRCETATVGFGYALVWCWYCVLNRQMDPCEHRSCQGRRTSFFSRHNWVMSTCTAKRCWAKLQNAIHTMTLFTKIKATVPMIRITSRCMSFLQR